MNQLGNEIGPSDVTAIHRKRSKDDELHRVVRKSYKKNEGCDYFNLRGKFI
jgi:hypothetical protein